MKIAVVTNKLDRQGNITNGVRVYRAFTRLKHDASLIGHDDIYQDNIKKADIILFMGTAIYPENLNQFKHIYDLKKSDAVMALWYFDACNPNSNYGGSAEKHARIKSVIEYLDFLFTTDHTHPWENDAKNYYHLLQGVDETEFQKEQYYKNKIHQVVYAGGLGGIFNYRDLEINEIKKKFTTDIYSQRIGRRIYGDSMVAAYHGANVAYVPDPPPGLSNRYWSNRIYIATATGTPCVVGYAEKLGEHFKDNEEVLYFKNNNELIEKIEYLVNNDIIAERIGKAGRKRTLQDHTYMKRAEKMIKIINSD
jgi:spore maturation protein CgeB